MNENTNIAHLSIGEFREILRECQAPQHIIIGVSGVASYFSIGRKRAASFIKDFLKPAVIAGKGLDVVIDADKAMEIYRKVREDQTIKIQ